MQKSRPRKKVSAAVTTTGVARAKTPNKKNINSKNRRQSLRWADREPNYQGSAAAAANKGKKQLPKSTETADSGSKTSDDIDEPEEEHEKEDEEDDDLDEVDPDENQKQNQVAPKGFVAKMRQLLKDEVTKIQKAYLRTTLAAKATLIHRKSGTSLRKVIDQRIAKKQSKKLKHASYTGQAFANLPTKRGMWPKHPPMWPLCLDFLSFLLNYFPATQHKKVSLVSKTWSKAARRREQIEMKTATELALKRMAKVGAIQLPYLQSLIFRDANNIAAKYIYQLLKACKTVQRIHIVNCPTLNDSRFARILGVSENVKWIHVSMMIKLIEPAVESSSLEELSISDCSCLSGLRMRTENLDTLIISNCPELSDKGLSSIAASLPKLRKLEVVSADQLVAPTLRNNNVQIVIFFKCYSLSRPSIYAASMTEIDFSGCQHLQYPIISSLALTNFRLFHTNLMTGAQFLLPNCVTMNLHGGELVRDTAFDDAVKECTQIEELLISGYSTLRFPNLSAFPNLQHVSFEDCTRITDVSLQKIFGEENITWKSVRFANCEGIINPYIIMVSGIESMEFVGCAGIVSMSIISVSLLELVVSESPVLKTVTLQCPSLLELIFVKCPFLRIINSPDRFPDGSMSQVHYLSLAECPRMGPKQVQKAMASFPRLDRLVGPHCALPLTTERFPVDKKKLTELTPAEMTTVMNRGFSTKDPLPQLKVQRSIAAAVKERKAAEQTQVAVQTVIQQEVVRREEQQAFAARRAFFAMQQKQLEEAEKKKIKDLEDRRRRAEETKHRGRWAHGWFPSIGFRTYEEKQYTIWEQ